jgi:hypothetical protein
MNFQYPKLDARTLGDRLYFGGDGLEYAAADFTERGTVKPARAVWIPSMAPETPGGTSSIPG